MITTLTILSAIICIAISWYVGNKLLDTLDNDWDVQLLHTFVGFLMVSLTFGVLTILGIGFHMLWSYLL